MFLKFHVDVNVVELNGDDEEDNISNDDENEYHQADDEESDQVEEEEAETQRMANININADIGDKSTEYEIVDINSHGCAVQKKRYIYKLQGSLIWISAFMKKGNLSLSV